MARKPHNYAHFQNLVNELKEQNEHNFAGLQTHLEIQTEVLQSMKGFMLKGVQQEQADKIKEKENRLEGRDSKGKKKEWILPKGMRAGGGKGFMGMLGNFLSTALIGLPGGLRKFLPRTLGLALLPKLARGVALMVAGPSLIKALEAGFSQKTFSAGVTGFIDSYFAPKSKGYTSLVSAAAGGAGKAALLGFALLGPRGAVIAGILGGALTGLNHIFTKDKSKMNSADVMGVMKKYLLDNVGMFVGAAGAIIGMKTLMPLGPAGMIAGGILGAGIGIIGAGSIKEMMAVEEGGEADLGKAFKQGLKNWYMKLDWKSLGGWPAGLGAAFGASVFSKFGPHGILAGAIFGAAAGLLAGPILGEALMIDKNEGKGMADAMKVATGRYLSRMMAKHGLIVNTTIAGGVIGGVMGAGAFSIPGMIAGAILGAVFGVILEWIRETLGQFAGSQFAKAFGIKKVLDPKSKEIAKAQEAFKKELANAPQHTKNIVDWDNANAGHRGRELKKYYREYKAKGDFAGTDLFDEKSARRAAKKVDTAGWGSLWDNDRVDAGEMKYLQLQEGLKKKLKLIEEKNQPVLQQQQAPPLSIINDNSTEFRSEGSIQTDFIDLSRNTLIDNIA